MTLTLILLFFSCSTSSKIAENKELKEVAFSKVHGGSSGMVQISDNDYLVVYDFKNFEKGPRLGKVAITDSSFIASPIKIINWEAFNTISSDLESITKIPGFKDEFLIAESGNWQGKLGRVFHIKLNKDKDAAEVKGIFQLPMNNRNDIGMVGDQNEGMVCLLIDNRYFLILGERGGSEVYPSGLLTWCELDFESYQLNYSTKGKSGIKISAPGSLNTLRGRRDITDLYLDNKDILWSAASFDSGDLGPFNSKVYPIGKIHFENEILTISESKDKINIPVPGFKIEALSAAPAITECDCLSIGSEDELLGGTWRIIAKPVKK